MSHEKKTSLTDSIVLVVLWWSLQWLNIIPIYLGSIIPYIYLKTTRVFFQGSHDDTMKCIVLSEIHLFQGAKGRGFIGDGRSRARACWRLTGRRKSGQLASKISPLGRWRQRCSHWMFNQSRYTLQGIDISHLGKRKIIFKMAFLGDMLVSWRVYTSWYSLR